MRETWDDSEIAQKRWSPQQFLRGLPPLSRWVFISTVVLFIGQLALGKLALTPERYDSLIRTFGLVPTDVLSRQLCLWQLVTYMFLHSLDNWLHIIFNMFVFVMFAPEVERAMGAKRFGILYFGSGIVAALVSCVALMFSRTPIIGASGAILGVLAAYGSLFPNRILRFLLVFPMKAKHFVLLIAALEMLAVFMGNQDGIASITHLGGFAAGILYMKYEWTLRSAMLRTVDRHYDRARESDRQIRARVDQILAKVNREGIKSLTWRERTFLKRAGKRFKKQHS